MKNHMPLNDINFNHISDLELTTDIDSRLTAVSLLGGGNGFDPRLRIPERRAEKGISFQEVAHQSHHFPTPQT